MKSFRVPRYLKRYEDVVFDLEQPLDINPNDGQYQKREVMKIVADNSGETTPFDWYSARLSIDFKVDKLVDHAALNVLDTKWDGKWIKYSHKKTECYCKWKTSL